MKMNSEYIEYIHSREWREVARAAIKRAGNRCQRCGAKNITLQVHHRTYRHFKNEKPEDLVVLCVPCHERADKLRRARRFFFRLFSARGDI